MKEDFLEEMISELELKTEYSLAEQKLEGTVFYRKETKFQSL